MDLTTPDLLRLESTGYWYTLVIVFGIVGAWETVRPRYSLTQRTGARWLKHLTLFVIGNLMIAVLLPVTSVMAAASIPAGRWGLLNQPSFPPGFSLAAGFLLLDLFQYVRHWLFHRVSLLWRVHQVHHDDSDFDLSLNLRFHPLEMLLTHASYLGFILLIAPPPTAVLIVAFTQVAIGFFVHANAMLPRPVDRFLRMLLITPDFHRIHHSIDESDQQRNLGTSLPWWDYLLGTYRADPTGGQQGMQFGVREVPPERGARLTHMLAAPFVTVERNKGRG